MIVVDASAMVAALLEPAASPRIVSAVAGRDGQVAAPELLDVEVMSVLRRWERKGDLDDMQAQATLAELFRLPIARHRARDLAAEAWSLRHNLTAYDAQYVALARVLDAELLTTDSGMADVAARVGVAVVDIRR